MSDAVQIALIAAGATVGSGIIAGGFAYLVKRLDKLDVTVDGRLTELLNLTKKASHAEGKLEGEKNGKETK